MVWVKIDDHYDEHPKIAQAGPLCVALWLAGLAYCNRNLTDGFIPWSIAQTLVHWQYVEPDGRLISIDVGCGMSGDEVSSNAVISRLVDVGLWEEVTDGTDAKHPRVSGYRIHDYGDFQPSKEQVLRERELTAARVSKFKAKKRLGNAQGNAVSNAPGNAQVTLPPVPVPVPNKKQEPPIVPQGGLNGFDEFWTIYPKKIGKGAARKAWVKLHPPLEAVLSSLKQQRKCEQWTRNRGQFIPNPSTWLNQERWTDEVPKDPLASSPPPRPEPEPLPVSEEGRKKIRELIESIGEKM